MNDFDLSKKDKQISKTIIDCIDESGMLTEDTSEIEEISNFIFTELEIEMFIKKYHSQASSLWCGVQKL